MFLDTRMPVPDIPGRIIRKVIKGTTYIYYKYGAQYDSNRKFTIPKRTTIGKLSDDGLMIPNENFHKYLPAIPLPCTKEDSKRSSCLHIGAFAVIRKLVKECGIYEALSAYFLEEDLGLLLDLAAYSLICENNAGQYYPSYAYNHPLFTTDMRIYSDSKVSTFLMGITEEQRLDFLNTWNSSRKHEDKIYISYDSTNKNSQAGDLALVEYGHAKDDRCEPIFNYSIAFDCTNREPLFYEEYPGSIVDVSQLKFMLEKAKAYGYANVGFILDRGYFSRDNIAYMDACGFDFVLMVKGMSKLVSALVDSVRGTFETSRNSAIREYKTYGTTAKCPIYPGDTKERYFHIYHSSTREATEREQVEIKMDRLANYLRRHENGKITGREVLERYFELTFDKSGEKFLFGREKTEVVERELSLCGYFAIVTSEKMTAREALLLYKNRDNSEKLFRGDKSYLGNHSLRVGSNESLEAKIFIEFIALIIRNKIYNSLKLAVLRNERKANYMTVPAAIRELEKIELIRQNDQVYRLDYAVTATQKTILSAFGLDESFIMREAEEIGGLLSNKQKENPSC